MECFIVIFTNNISIHIIVAVKNDKKSHRILFRKNNILRFNNYTCLSSIKCSDSIVYLGFHLHNSLTWSTHIDFYIRKASKYIYLIRVLKPIVSKKHLITIFKCLILSTISYGSPVYLGSISATDINKIKVFINTIHRIICNPFCTNNCLGDYNSYRHTLGQRLFNKALSDTCHILHSLMPPFLPSGRRLFIPYCKTTKRLKNFIIHSSILHNSNANI